MMPPQAQSPSAFLSASFIFTLHRVIAISLTSLPCPPLLWAPSQCHLYYCTNRLTSRHCVVQRREHVSQEMKQKYEGPGSHRLQPNHTAVPEPISVIRGMIYSNWLKPIRTRPRVGGQSHPNFVIQIRVDKWGVLCKGNSWSG